MEKRQGVESVIFILVLGFSLAACGGGGIEPGTSPDNNGTPPSQPDVVPDAVNIKSVDNAAPGLLIESKAFVIAGLSEGVSIPIRVANGEYSINGSAFSSTPGEVQNDDLLVVGVRAQEPANAVTKAVVDIGEVKAEFQVITGSPNVDFEETDNGGFRFTLNIDLAGVHHGQFMYADGSGSGYVPIGDLVSPDVVDMTLRVPVHLLDWNSGQIMLVLCDSGGACSQVPGLPVSLEQAMSVSAVTEMNGSNTEEGDRFGYAVALTSTGDLLAVGAPSEDGEDNLQTGAGAVYLFAKAADGWTQVNLLRPTSASGARFGAAVALSASADRLAVSAPGQLYNGSRTGSVHLYRRESGNWVLEQIIRPPEPQSFADFGFRIAMSSDGETLIVTDQYDDRIYVFARTGEEWTLDIALQPHGFQTRSEYAGMGLALSGDGTVLAVGDPTEDGKCIGVNPDTCETFGTGENSGAVVIFRKSTAGEWLETDYIKSSLFSENQNFGLTLSFNDDGSRLIVGAAYDDSSGTGVDDPASDPFGAFQSGAAYSYVFDSLSGAPAWRKDAFIKASNTERNDLFGSSVAISGDGRHAIVFTAFEESASLGIGGDQLNNDEDGAGAFYVYRRDSQEWKFLNYGKPSRPANFENNDSFLPNLAVSTTANTFVLGHPGADAVFIY